MFKHVDRKELYKHLINTDMVNEISEKDKDLFAKSIAGCSILIEALIANLQLNEVDIQIYKQLLLEKLDHLVNTKE